MSIEAMKLALETLDGIHPDNMTTMAEEAWGKAIETLRAAIEQAEKQEPVVWADKYDIEREGHDFYVNRQQPAKDGEPLYTAPPQREWMEQERAVGYREGHQAALKQRVWQWLTDQEINILFKNSLKSVPESVIWNISRAIEAKLKEKNNG